MFGIPGKQAVNMTPKAAAQISKLMAKDGHEGLRIGVKKGGCAGMEYTVDLVEEPIAGEDKVEVPEGTVYVAPQAVLFLLGTQLDFEITKLRTGFVFNNPNQSSSCGCGESVELTPAEMTPEMIQARKLAKQ